MKRSTIKELIRPLIKKILKENSTFHFEPGDEVMATLKTFSGQPKKLISGKVIKYNPTKKVYTVHMKQLNQDAEFEHSELSWPTKGIKKEASTSADAGPYQTPNAFASKIDKKHHTIATQLGYKETNASADQEDKAQSRVNKNKMRNESIIPSVGTAKETRFHVDGSIVAGKHTIEDAIKWMDTHHYTYETLQELMRDYFLTFPGKFSADDFELD